MKNITKNLIITLFISIFIFSCNKVNKNDLNSSIIEKAENDIENTSEEILKVENNIQNISEEILNVEKNIIRYDYLNKTNYHYANGNGTIIDIKADGNIEWVFRKHYQNIQIGKYSSIISSRSNLNIYNQPFLESNIISKLNAGDNINIIQIAEFFDERRYHIWLNVMIDDIIDGWLYFNLYDINEIQAQFSVPYYNNRWEINNIIIYEDHAWTIRKMIYQHVSIWVNEEYYIRDRPGNINSNIISIITPPVNMSPLVTFEVIEATEETEIIDGKNDRWLKIEYNGIEGWIFGGYTDVERGGIKYYIPEDMISWYLEY